MATKKPDDVSIGKFDILATYTYAKALLDGESEESAKERGMVAAMMGAKAKGGHASHNDYQTAKTSAEKKKKSTITAELFDRQVADKMGPSSRRHSCRDGEARRGGAVLRRGQAARENPGHLGCEDQRGGIQGAGGPAEGGRLDRRPRIPLLPRRTRSSSE